METNKNLKIAFPLLTACFILLFQGCLGQQHPTGIKMELTNIVFECYEQADTNELKPHAMFLNVNVANTAERSFFFSTYSPRYDHENRKYGYFQYVIGADTIPLFARYESLYEFKQGEGSDFHLYYEGDRDRLKKFVIHGTDDLERIKPLLVGAKLCFVPIPEEDATLNMIRSTFCDIKTDAFVLEYVSEGKGKIALAYDEHQWKELSLD